MPGEYRGDAMNVNSSKPGRGRSHIDPEDLARRLLRLFIELNRSGTAVLIATHDLSLMDQVDARRMILSEGRLEIYD